MSGPGSADVLADVIVVAAGASRRMDGIDKMLVPIGGRPMLAWTLGALAASPVVERMVVVASSGNIAEISGAPWLPDRVTRVVVGGDRRQASVAAGVDALGRGDRESVEGDAADRVILVHDGARPLISAVLIESVARAVEDRKSTRLNSSHH